MFEKNFIPFLSYAMTASAWSTQQAKIYPGKKKFGDSKGFRIDFERPVFLSSTISSK